MLDRCHEHRAPVDQLRLGLHRKRELNAVSSLARSREAALASIWQAKLCPPACAPPGSSSMRLAPKDRSTSPRRASSALVVAGDDGPATSPVPVRHPTTLRALSVYRRQDYDAALYARDEPSNRKYWGKGKEGRW